MKFWGLGCHPMLKQQSPARRHPTLCASGVVGLVPWWLHRALQHSGAARTAQPAKISRRPGHAVAPAPCDHWNWPLPLRLLPTSGSATTCNMQLREGGLQKLAGPKSIPWLPDMPKLAKPLRRKEGDPSYSWRWRLPGFQMETGNSRLTNLSLTSQATNSSTARAVQHQGNPTIPASAQVASVEVCGAGRPHRFPLPVTVHVILGQFSVHPMSKFTTWRGSPNSPKFQEFGNLHALIHLRKSS